MNTKNEQILRRAYNGLSHIFADILLGQSVDDRLEVAGKIALYTNQAFLNDLDLVWVNDCADDYPDAVLEIFNQALLFQMLIVSNHQYLPDDVLASDEFGEPKLLSPHEMALKLQRLELELVNS